MINRNNRWANYNGPGKPITEDQLHKLLAEQFGIEPQLSEDGKLLLISELLERFDAQFENAWQVFLSEVRIGDEHA